MLSETPSAPWLPARSTAEVWVGQDCWDYEPAIIVRLLLRRPTPEEFGVLRREVREGTRPADEVPGTARSTGSAQDGIADLMSQILGAPI